ncbi:MAG: NAD(+)/NADH kinase [Spirochaetaceae bacterium]|jgi:NAD+ kinase|nr:NAD(+)/NADH kinase [Spirochaetaceae bacterium]
MKKCLLIINTLKKDAGALGALIREELARLGIAVRCLNFPEDCGSGVQGPDDCGFAVTLGGDGTVLFAARLCAPLGIPILPVNLGSFGFICGIEKSAWKEELRSFLEGRADIHRRSMAKVTILRGDKNIGESIALNDIVVSSKNAPRLISLEISCNGVSFGLFKSDAVILSTATGSTAYSAAAGGPIIDPALDALVLTPVCPFSLSSRPLVLSSASEVVIEQYDPQGGDIQALADGQPLCSIRWGDKIIVKKSEHSALLLAGSPARFYAALRSKMNWSGGPSGPH